VDLSRRCLDVTYSGEHCGRCSENKKISESIIAKRDEKTGSERFYEEF